MLSHGPEEEENLCVGLAVQWKKWPKTAFR